MAHMSESVSDQVLHIRQDDVYLGSFIASMLDNPMHRLLTARQPTKNYRQLTKAVIYLSLRVDNKVQSAQGDTCMSTVGSCLQSVQNCQRHHEVECRRRHSIPVYIGARVLDTILSTTRCRSKSTWMLAHQLTTSREASP